MENESESFNGVHLPRTFQIILVSLATACYFYFTNAKFRYYCNFVIYVGGMNIASVILLPVFIFRPRDVRNLVSASYVTRPISTLIGVNWELRGAEYLSKDECYIIVSNHQSSLDIMGMLNFWHVMEKCTVVAKREILYAAPFSIAAWLCGLIFIDRKHVEKAKAAINAAVVDLKKNRIKLWVFPEGTRRNTREIHPFKKGAFHVAIKAQVPILPVVFSSYSTFMDKKNKRFDAGNVIVTTLEPISTEGMTSENIEELMERTRNLMMKTFESTTQEVEAKAQTDCLKKQRRRQDKVSPIDLTPPSMQRVDLG